MSFGPTTHEIRMIAADALVCYHRIYADMETGDWISRLAAEATEAAIRIKRHWNSISNSNSTQSDNNRRRLALGSSPEDDDFILLAIGELVLMRMKNKWPTRCSIIVNSLLSSRRPLRPPERTITSCLEVACIFAELTRHFSIAGDVEHYYYRLLPHYYWKERGGRQRILDSNCFYRKCLVLSPEVHYQCVRESKQRRTKERRLS